MGVVAKRSSVARIGWWRNASFTQPAQQPLEQIVALTAAAQRLPLDLGLPGQHEGSFVSGGTTHTEADRLPQPASLASLAHDPLPTLTGLRANA